jgi:hypothetical protein
MSKFEDPAYMAESKAGIVHYMMTGRFPPNWFATDRSKNAGVYRPCFLDWELKAIASEIARDRNQYSKTASRLTGRDPGVIRWKVKAEGGREAFLAKYGDL